MKLYLALAVVTVLSFSNSYAQLFRAGISAGTAISQYDGDGYSGYNKIGLNAGGFVKTELNDKWAFQFEIIYVQKGAIRNINPAKNYVNQYALKLNYMEVPLLLKYKYKKVVVESGIGIGVLIKSYEEANYGDITGVRPFNKTELSFNAGVNYPLSDKLQINWRFTYSLLPARPFPAGATYLLNLGECNNVISFTLKYAFGKPDEKK